MCVQVPAVLQELRSAGAQQEMAERGRGMEGSEDRTWGRNASARNFQPTVLQPVTPAPVRPVTAKMFSFPILSQSLSHV